MTRVHVLRREQRLADPYRLWRHAHDFAALPEGGTLMGDTVRYRPGSGALGVMALPLVRRDLDSIFDFRRDAIGRLLGAGGTVSPATAPAPGQHRPA